MTQITIRRETGQAQVARRQGGQVQVIASQFSPAPPTVAVHDQPVAAAVWNIVHNLGYFPSVTVVDSADAVCFGEVRYLDENRVQVTFSSAFAGRAYLS